MPRHRVVEILGEPKDTSKRTTQFPKVKYFPGLVEASIWKDDHVRIVITFDSKDLVNWKRIDKALTD
jgi:hypothetical protein